MTQITAIFLSARVAYSCLVLTSSATRLFRFSGAWDFGLGFDSVFSAFTLGRFAAMYIILPQPS